MFKGSSGQLKFEKNYHSGEIYFISDVFSLFVMPVAQVKMAINSPRDIAMLMEREEVMPSILKLRESFITKFLLAEFSTFPEDKLSGFTIDPKSAVVVNKKMCEVGTREAQVLG